jgi:hypothetical protein
MDNPSIKTLSNTTEILAINKISPTSNICNIVLYNGLTMTGNITQRVNDLSTIDAINAINLVSNVTSRIVFLKNLCGPNTITGNITSLIGNIVLNNTIT